MYKDFFDEVRTQFFALLLAVPLATAVFASSPAEFIEANFDVHPELEMTLFAEEPLLVNPTNIDVDHLGRVWVCEVLYYRHFRNTDAPPRIEGDRIGDKLALTAMYESILYPSAGISHNYESWLILTDEGQTFNGVLLGESAEEVRIKDDKGIEHSIDVDSIEEKKKLELSLMPADLHELMTEQELIDLVSYLATLKKVAAP